MLGRRIAALTCCTLALVAPVGAWGLYAPQERTPAKAEMRAKKLAHQLARERAQWETERAHMRRQAQPNVDEALTLAAAVFHVDRARMAAVVWRESRMRPWAKNPSSTAGGLAQFLLGTWNNTPCGKAGLSRFSTYPAALCMAWSIWDHGWSDWALTS